MRRHTTYGYEMVRSGVPASAALVVLNHHQRWDGSGYPSRVDHGTGNEMSPLSGRQIPVFSRITLMADVYDAATSQRRERFRDERAGVGIPATRKEGVAGLSAGLFSLAPFPPRLNSGGMADHGGSESGREKEVRQPP